MKPSIIIIGAGGHGRVVYDAIIAENKFTVIGFADSLLPIGTKVVHAIEVVCNTENISFLIQNTEYFIVAIGNNDVRESIFKNTKKTLKPISIFHPSAVIGSNVTIGVGTVVLANAIINSSCNIGENTIVNTGVIIDHDCNVGNHVYLKLGVVVANNITITDNYTSVIGEIITTQK